MFIPSPICQIFSSKVIYQFLIDEIFVYKYSDDEVYKLTETFWSWKLRQFPESATREGFDDYDDRLESFTLQTFEYRKVGFGNLHCYQ